MNKFEPNGFDPTGHQTSQRRESFWHQRRTIFGTAHLVRLAFEQKDTAPIWKSLCERLLHDALDAAALLDMSVLLLTAGKYQDAMQAQKAALDVNRTYRIQRGQDGTFRVLVLMAPGDLMSNTPIDFLLEDSNFCVIQYFIDEPTSGIQDLPDHDVMFMGVSESPQNAEILEKLEKLLGDWKGPILNNSPLQIKAMTRDGIAQKFHQNSSVFAPQTLQINRSGLEQIARGDMSTNGYPMIVRPLGTHAGQGMEKIEKPTELLSFLHKHNEQSYYVCPFIDYSNADQLFRKYRIAFINGEAVPCHMAVSEHWMVHYLNADMDKHPLRRAEEESWFNSFDDFAKVHTDAFRELHNLIPLDYFVIDCAILPDGKLFLFEADVGMIVHNMDPPALYPYKNMAMKKLFLKFRQALEDAAASKQYVTLPHNAETPTFLLL